jgi:hypothetical protein
MPFVEGSEQPEEDFKASSTELEAPGLNYENGLPDFRLILILRRTFANYRTVCSQFPTVACLIHAEACCLVATWQPSWFFVGQQRL